MALNGEGEPAPTLLQTATQFVKIELYRQWQTYQNGVHMDRDTFDSIDFEALALEALGAAGLTFTADGVTDVPRLRRTLTRPTPFAAPTDAVAPSVPDVGGWFPQPGTPAWEEKHDQVQG